MNIAFYYIIKPFDRLATCLSPAVHDGIRLAYLSIYHCYKLLFILHSHIPLQCHLQLKHHRCFFAGANIAPLSMATNRQPYGGCTDHNESVGDLLNYTSSVLSL